MGAYLETAVDTVCRGFGLCVPAMRNLQSKPYSHTFKIIDSKSELPVNFDNVRIYANFGFGIFKSLGEHSTTKGEIKLDYRALPSAHDFTFVFFKKIDLDERVGCLDCGNSGYTKVYSTTVEPPANDDVREIKVVYENDSLASLRGEPGPVYKASWQYINGLFVETIVPDAIKNLKLKYLNNWIIKIDDASAHYGVPLNFKKLMNGISTMDELIAYYGFDKNVHKLTPEESINLSLNGMPNERPKKMPSEKNKVYFETQWDEKEILSNDNPADLRSVRLVADKVGDRLSFDRLEIKRTGSDVWDRFYNDGSKQFEIALRRYNASMSVRGVVFEHLNKTHLEVERIVRCMDRTLMAPCWNQLFGAQRREVKDIDNFGSKTIFGSNGVIAISLKPSSVLKILESHLDSLNWKREPRQPKYAEDLAAIDDNIIWSMLTEVVDEYFAKNQDEIIKNWPEVRLLSDHLQEMLPSYSMITDTDHPQEVDLNRFKRFCVYFMSKPFLHDRMHYAQEWLMNPDVCPLAPEGDEGKMSLDNARKQLLVVKILSEFKWNTIEDNDFGDVNELLIEKYKKVKPLLKTFKGKASSNIYI